MVVNKGYKHAEIGVIPEDWDTSYVKDIARVTTGSKNTQDKDENGQYPFFVRSQTIERINTYSFDGEAVLTAGDGVGTGKVFHYINGKFDDHQRVYRITNFTDSIDGYYFYLYFSQHFYSRIMQMTAKSSVDSVRKEMIADMVIPYPRLKVEQNAISRALSDTDALIHSLEQLIVKKQNIKQGAIQELLHPKEGWIVKKLGKTATLKARIGWQGLTTSEYLESGEFYLVTGTDFTNGSIDWDNCHFVHETRYKQDRNIQLKSNDVLVTKDGTIGKVALIDKLSQPATLNSGVFVIRPIDKSFDPKFFFYLLSSEIFTDFLNQLSAGSTINHLYQKDFINFKYKTPESITEQQKIASVLFEMDNEIFELQNKLTKYCKIKMGMMHNLLTGRIRLI